MSLICSLLGFILLWIYHEWDKNRVTPYQREKLELKKRKDAGEIDMDEYLKISWEIFGKYYPKQ